MSSLPPYINKEIPEWNTSDLSNWLLDNKCKKISELFKKYNINGYDLFFINEEILKNEFGLNSFHERISTLKTLKKLIYAHLKLNIQNLQNGEQKTVILDNNLNISLENITKSVGNIFNIDPDDIIYKDYSQHQIISPTIKIVELMILFPKIYKCLNITNKRQDKSYQENQKKNKNNKNKNLNINNVKIKSKKNNYIDKDFDFKEINNKMKNDFQNINKNNIINNDNNITHENNNYNNNQISLKMNKISGSNSSSLKPSVELYINENEENFDLNNENKRYLYNRKEQNKENIINNIKVNRNYLKHNSPSRLINFNRPKSFKEKNNKSNIQKSTDIDKDYEINIYNNEFYNKKRYLNINEGISIENSDFMDKNVSSNEGENKSKIYINNIIKNSGGDYSEYSMKNNSFPSLSNSDKINNYNENDKMDLRHLNNEPINENDTRPLNMKQSYKGPQKNRIFNDDIIGGNL